MNISQSSNNTFLVNGAASQTSMPPTSFESGNFSLAALLSLNLGPSGLTFAWNIDKHSAKMEGASLSQQCPNVSMTIFLTTTSTPSNTSGLPAFLAQALSISESRILVSSATPSQRATLATLPITIEASSDSNSALLASYQLSNLLQTDQQFKNDISQTIGTDVVGSSPDTSQISPATPEAEAPSKKDEMWVGTLVGIIFSSTLGTAIVLIFLTAIFFRFSAYREEKRLNEMTTRLLLSSQPLISPSSGEKLTVQNGHH